MPKPPSLFRRSSTGLLVSVRNASEATTALAGGADVIDVKEPTRGSLGRADASSIDDVVAAVSGARPVTAAMGELLEFQDGSCANQQQPIPIGVIAFKIGLAGCAKNADWRRTWQQVIHRVVGECQHEAAFPVGVAYADWREAAAPKPSDVLCAAHELNCPALLIDTWDKTSGSLFEHWPVDGVREFIQKAHIFGIAVVLAGSLRESDISVAARVAADLVAVRSAACEGGRNGTVSIARVMKLKESMKAAFEPAARCQLYSGAADRLPVKA